MAHYLYVLQSVTLNHLEARMRTPLDCYSQVGRRRLSVHKFMLNVFIFVLTKRPKIGTKSEFMTLFLFRTETLF